MSKRNEKTKRRWALASGDFWAWGWRLSDGMSASVTSPSPAAIKRGTRTKTGEQRGGERERAAAAVRTYMSAGRRPEDRPRCPPTQSGPVVFVAPKRVRFGLFHLERGEVVPWLRQQRSCRRRRTLAWSGSRRTARWAVSNDTQVRASQDCSAQWVGSQVVGKRHGSSVSLPSWG